MSAGERWDAIVVGAGISGLAAAYELARRDQRVLVLEADGVGTGQSAGLARIFRVAHADPRLCGLAVQARAGWRRWEQELDAGRLLGSEGLAVAGAERAAAHGAAMAAAGAPHEALDRAAIRARVPLLRAAHPWDVGLWDPLAGSLRVRRTLAALARAVTVRRARVAGVEAREGRATVRLTGPDARAGGGAAGAEQPTAGGATLHAPVALVCAGLATGPLVAPLGLELGVAASHHVRLTYRARRPRAGACLIAPEAYGLPVGTTGRWALGMHEPDGGHPLDGVSAARAAADARGRHARWVPEVFDGLDPEPVDEVRCVALAADWLDAGGDGFAAERCGPVVAFAASNVMKFGPLIGERLAATVLDADLGVHPDLRRPAASRAG